MKPRPLSLVLHQGIATRSSLILLLRQTAARLLGLVLALVLLGSPAQAAGPQARGNGVMRSPDGLTAFVLDLDETRPLNFTYWDYAIDPPRVLVFTEPPAVDCLGELFGGQTVRLIGLGLDSLSPGQSITLQLFLVDGGSINPDFLSLKATRSDGTIVYITYLRPLETGNITISCPA
jgi:hypothetical protein